MKGLMAPGPEDRDFYIGCINRIGIEDYIVE